MKFNCPNCQYEYDTMDFVFNQRFPETFDCNQCDLTIELPDCQPDYDAQLKDDKIDFPEK